MKQRDYNPECQVDGVGIIPVRSDKDSLTWGSTPKLVVSWPKVGEVGRSRSWQQLSCGLMLFPPLYQKA